MLLGLRFAGSRMFRATRLLSSGTFQTPQDNNIPPGVLEKVESNLHLRAHHPLNILRKKIYNFFDSHLVDSFGEKVSFKKVKNIYLPSEYIYLFFLSKQTHSSTQSHHKSQYNKILIPSWSLLTTSAASLSTPITSIPTPFFEPTLLRIKLISSSLVRLLFS